jgi:hypothetical protein
MKKSAPRKLVVRGDTLRTLGSLELREAVGGGETNGGMCPARKLDLSLAPCTTKQ